MEGFVRGEEVEDVGEPSLTLKRERGGGAEEVVDMGVVDLRK